MGALEGIRIIEIASIGPGPFCAMMLADHGAEVIRVCRVGEGHFSHGQKSTKDVLLRSRKTIELDLKSLEGRKVFRDLVRSADGVIEGFRPGVAERLGLGPDDLLSENPRLVYGRMTGWGQTGPLAQTAGHDINYIALSGNLHTYGPKGGKPIPPLNAVGDFGGGGMFLAFGMLAGIISSSRTGQGQVIDCAMAEGAAVLASFIWSFRASGMWNDERGTNLIDMGSHFYNVYETSDQKYVAVGPIEEKFWLLLLEKLGLADDAELRVQTDVSTWEAGKQKLADRFAEKTRDDWAEIFEGSDACLTPVLSMDEAPNHPHAVARGSFVEIGGVTQPAPAPRFSRTPSGTPRMASGGLDTACVLADLGYPGVKIDELREAGVIR